MRAHKRVCVCVCVQQEGVGPCRETTLGAYLDWWRARGSHNGSSETGTRHTSGCADKREGLLCEGVWYLKVGHVQHGR